MTRYRRLVIVGALVSAIWQPIPSSAGPWTPGMLVDAEVLRTGGGEIMITSPTVRPFGFARLNGRPLTIECIHAKRFTDVWITPNPLCLVCPQYVSSVAMRGRLANGQKRWIAMASVGAGYITVDIAKSPSSGRCGAPFQDSLHFPTRFRGYVIVV